MAKPTVLIIDDERYFLLFAKEMTEDAGYMVIATDDVEEGVRMFYEKKPDALVMDIIMPKEFGTEVCRDLKETDQGQNTPIILMSSGVKEMTDEGGGLAEYKADDYILKPFEKEVYIGILNKYLKRDKRPVIEEGIDTEREATPKGKESQAGSSDLKGASIDISQGQGEIIVSMPVNNSTRPIFMDNPMVNIKTGGMFLTADYPAALGSKVNLKLKCGTEEVVVRGMVVWVQPANIKTHQSAGMGIRFHDQNSEGLKKLKDYVFSLRG